MSFKNLDLSKLQISQEKKDRQIKNTYKGNVQTNIGITDHVLFRFAERHMNGTKLNISQIREYVQNLVHEQGIKGYPKGDQSFIALPKHGIFIMRGIAAVTFIGINDMNSFYKQLFIKLLNKGHVE